MLVLNVEGDEIFNEETNEFTTVGDLVVRMEHSLLSLSKWESIWEKPFLGPHDRTSEETLSYLECMLIDEELPRETILKLTDQHMDEINTYISAKQTATWFGENPNAKTSREIITNEVIYYWLISLNIPIECEKWHLNRLFTLIKVCNQKNAPAKKMSRSDIAARNRQLNEQRKKELGTSG